MLGLPKMNPTRGTHLVASPLAPGIQEMLVWIENCLLKEKELSNILQIAPDGVQCD